MSAREHRPEPRLVRERQESGVLPATSRALSAPPSDSDEEHADLVVSAAKAPILIVDDVPANLLGLEAVLESLGQPIVRASSGDEALRKLLAEDFAVVLLDVQMPGIDGFETASLIKKHPRVRSVPILFVSAISRDSAHVFRGYEHGAVDFLLKPLDPDILRSKVRVFLDLYLRGERIKAQAELIRTRDLELAERRNRDRYLHLMEVMPNPLWATTDDGTVHYANRAWREYSGFSSTDLVGFTDRRVVHEEDRPEVATAWLVGLQRGTPFEIECRLQRSSDRTYRWHLLRATPEGLGRGDGEGWIVSATDIDERKRGDELRAEILRREQLARREAEAANRSKDEFLATVSHELRAPLHAILGWIEILRAGGFDASEVERALDTIGRNAEAQSALVDDLLNVSRVVNGKFDIQVRVADLATLGRAAVDALAPQAESKGVQIVLDLAPGADDPIAIDPQRIQQVLWNLVSNAVKFTPTGGLVKLRVGISEGRAEIRVTDTGVGMSPEFLRVAFDRFSQADGTIRRSQGGLGLGLFIAKHLIELHGGTLAAASEGPGTGSCFTASFPSRPAVRESTDPHVPSDRWAAPARVKGGHLAAKPLRGITVLVVDDDRDARELVSMTLERAGAKTLSCGEAREAVDAVREQRPDLLVSDIGLPGEDGYAMLARIRALGVDRGGMIPAIAVSGYARANDRTRALAAGFQAHLSKPVELAELLALVVRIARRPEANVSGADAE